MSIRDLTLESKKASRLRFPRRNLVAIKGRKQKLEAS